MLKPRIIIADADINYIIPLQLKFIEEYLDKIELEIITDKNYFEKLFSSPQSVSVLVVSEDFYDSSLQRHNVQNCFIMTEQIDKSLSIKNDEDRIYKYSNIWEIFNEITGKSAGVLDVDAGNKKETQIILVYSASGGMGQTRVAMGVSECLAKNYKKVLYINAGHLQSFQSLLDNETPIAASDVYAKFANASDNIYNDIKYVLRKEKFTYLPPFKAALMSLGLDYSLYEKIILSAKKSTDFDYIVVDADSTFDEDKAQLLGIADKVIIVTEQTTSAVYATNVLVSNLTGMSEEKYIFVCNNFKKDRDNALISPPFTMKFTVSDYIEYNERYDQMKCADLVKNSGIQRTAFLVM